MQNNQYIKSEYIESKDEKRIEDSSVNQKINTNEYLSSKPRRKIFKAKLIHDNKS